MMLLDHYFLREGVGRGGEGVGTVKAEGAGREAGEGGGGKEDLKG